MLVDATNRDKLLREHFAESDHQIFSSLEVRVFIILDVRTMQICLFLWYRATIGRRFFDYGRESRVVKPSPHPRFPTTLAVDIATKFTAELTHDSLWLLWRGYDAKTKSDLF